MALFDETHRHHRQPIDALHHFFHSTASNLCSLLPHKTTPSLTSTKPTSTSRPRSETSPTRFFVDSSLQPLSLLSSSFTESTQKDPLPSRPSLPPSAMKGVTSDSGSRIPSTVRISSLNSNGKGGGPAFMGQVFSMCDLSGTGLMAVSTHFDIPFVSKRTPEWLKKMFAAVSKSERNGPVFRFFMDLGDAVSYVKRLNIPSGVVGACRLDLAFEHFKERPQLFQFVPNEKQVKEANKLLKAIPQNNRTKRVEGVPVFSAQNLDIAIATTDGIKWYTPFFFDKNMLDNILEESVDQHFHALIQTRHLQRRRDIVDDNLGTDLVEEIGESMWEATEVQEMMEEMGSPAIPLSVISKVAEIQLLHTVDKVLLGKKWVRKLAGIQPKFPYVVDSFERRSAVSFQRACGSSNLIANSTVEDDGQHHQLINTSEFHSEDKIEAEGGERLNFPFSMGDGFMNPCAEQQKHQSRLDERTLDQSEEYRRQQSRINALLPKITMVGISTSEAGHMSKASLKKTMEDLTSELERIDQASTKNESKFNERDPLFVANVGNYYPGVAKTSAARRSHSDPN